MKRFVLMWLMVMAASSAMAASCPSYEYAELKDMEEPDLTDLYCKTYKTYLKEMKFTTAQIKLGGSASNKNEEVCRDQVRKIERVFNSKFKKNPECTK